MDQLNKQTPSGRPPAGGRGGGGGAAAPPTTPSTTGQQDAGADLGVILANDRDRRTLAWLRAQVGDEAVRGAVGLLAGGRRPYLSNVAKALGVALPERLEATDRDTARRRLAAIRAEIKA